MIIELRKKSQITLPKEIVKKLNLKEGDTLDVSIKNGIINIKQVSIYPKDYVENLEKELLQLKGKKG
ncbi:MAG: AbrB/MazE/SpoVT family DNA-binding domain-containing protein [Bacilli bacterium]|nr:AbrB/MazE/SpoVT family DNA-binding domain-containing protein [Bacilli bacterium]